MSVLRDAWEAEAESWVVWARKPGHDSYWKFHRDIFRELLPAPPLRILDVGCGEGRLPRDLKSWGYDVAAVDASPTMVRHAREADPEGDYRVADGAALPFDDESFQVATAFMTLHDIDDFAGAIEQIARVLEPGGRMCAALVHPLASAGEFQGREPDAPFVIAGSYVDSRRVGGTAYTRDGMSMTFHSQHRPLQAYFDALAANRFVVDRLVEVPDMSDPPGSRWRRIPNFLQFRAVKT